MHMNWDKNVTMRQSHWRVKNLSSQVRKKKKKLCFQNICITNLSSRYIRPSSERSGKLVTVRCEQRIIIRGV